MVKLFLNLKVNHISDNVVAVMRRPEYYATIPKKYMVPKTSETQL